MAFSPCQLCGGSTYTELFDAQDYITHKSFKVIRCDGCKVVRVDPVPSVETIGDYYPELYYGETPFLYEKMDAAGRFKKVRPYVAPGSRVLDVGCGRGLVLGKLHEVGCQVVGTELSAHSSKYAREVLGLEIHQKSLEDCAFTENSFDVVTLFHSLEHLYDPAHTLKEAYRIIRPGGRILVEVPRFNSFYAKAFRDNWFHLDVPRHLYHFEDETLEALLEKAGFKLAEIKKYDIMYDSFGALQSLLNVVCSEFNLLNDLNTKRKSVGELLRGGHARQKADVVLSFTGQAFLYLPLVLVAYGLVPFNSGGTLKVWAIKI